MKIILVSGKAESGKDTFYQIAENYMEGNNCLKYSLASSLKRIAREMTWDGKKDERGRWFLQWLGDGGRKYNPNIWVELLIQQINDDYTGCIIKDEDILFITDCRLPNEVEQIKKFAAKKQWKTYTVRINRPKHTSRLTPEQLEDSTETALDDYREWDFIIENTGNLESYRLQCQDVMDTVTKVSREG